MKQQLPDGAKVKFHHDRVYRPGMEFFDALPRGGQTECIIILPDGTEIKGKARCSKKDNYCKRIGRDIAFGRALKALNTTT